jgi:hypothetical protein
MNTYNFTLILSESSQQIDNLEDLLFEAGCDDATLSFSNGITYLEFDRAMPFHDAKGTLCDQDGDQFSTVLNSAIKQVESIDNIFVIKHIIHENLVTK